MGERDGEKDTMRTRTAGQVLILAISILSLCLPSVITATAGDWKGNVRISIGEKNLDKDDWAPFAEHGEFGVEVTWGKKDWPVLFATDIFLSDDEQFATDPLDPFNPMTVMKATGETSEIGLGIRKIWGKKRFHPYVSGGLVFILAELNGQRVGLSGGLNDDDVGAGVWADGGAFWRIGPHWGLGIGARYSRAKVTLFGNDFEAGGRHYNVSWSYSWPAGS